VGGKDARISLISKEEGRSTLELFLKYFELEAKEIGKGKAAVMAHRKKAKEVKKENGEVVKEPAEEFSKVTAKLIGPNREAIAAVSIKSNVIAYVSVGTAQEVAAKGGRVKLLELDGVVASVNNVANETYPLRRPLNVITKGQAHGLVKDFIDFLTSEQGQKIVTSLEFVPVQRKVAKSS
jgi:phosphate transport system substrate-binding protein